MLRFRQYLNESALDKWYSQYERKRGAAPAFNPGGRAVQRDSQHPYTDAQINKGLGDLLKNPNLPDNAAVTKAPDISATTPVKRQPTGPYTDAQINKGLGDLLKNPKLPDNAAVKKAPTQSQKAPVASGDEEWDPEKSAKRLEVPKVQAPSLPPPFSHPSQGKMKSAMDRYQEWMRTGKSPPPTQENPKTGGSIEIPGAGNHQATVHVRNPATGQMDSIPSQGGHQVSVRIHNPQTGSILDVGPQQGQATGGHHRVTDDSYSDMVHKSLENIRGLGIPVPHFGGGQSQQPPVPQPAPRPQPAPQPQKAPQSSEAPGEQRPWIGKKFNKALDAAELMKRDPERALKDLLGPKYVPPN